MLLNTVTVRSVWEDLPELPVLPAVDDEVDGTIEDNKKVRYGHRYLRFINNHCQCLS